MKIRQIVAIGSILLLCMPMIAAASGGRDMEHGKMEGMDQSSMKGMGHGEMKGMDHGSMEMPDDTTMLQDDEREGVNAQAHLWDISEAMGKAGKSDTHHIMVKFTNSKTGEHMKNGSVGIKVIDPEGNKNSASKMMAMDGSFGAAITLSKKGPYEFEVGTRLSDKKKRKFRFKYTVE